MLNCSRGEHSQECHGVKDLLHFRDLSIRRDRAEEVLEVMFAGLILHPHHVKLSFLISPTGNSNCNCLKIQDINTFQKEHEQQRPEKMLLLSENTSDLNVFGEGLSTLRSVLYFFLGN